MARKTYAEIVEDMIGAVQSSSSSVDTKEGTFTRDVVIEPPALELDTLHEEIERVEKSQNPQTADDEGILKLAANLGLERGRPQKAIGRVFFYRSTAPTSDVTIPAGTRIGTASSAEQPSLWYATLATVTMYASLASSYYNASRSRYEIPASIQADTGGVEYNVALRTITVMQGTISGIDGVMNEEVMDGGEDEETITSLRDRIVTRISGNNVGTRDGFSALVETNESVSGVKVVGAGDPEMTRTTAGGVDIFVRGLVPASVSDTWLYSPTNPHTMTYQPVVISASGSIVGSESGVLEYGIHWDWLKGSGSFAGSIYGNDGIDWIQAPQTGEQLTASYLYNSLIPTLQTLTDRDDNKPVCADVMVKWATEVPINVTVVISLLSGFDASTVSADVSSVLSTALSAYALGEDVQQSDLVALVHAVAGVDDVRLPLSVFETAGGSISQDSDGNIPISSTSYASAGTIGVTVS